MKSEKIFNTLDNTATQTLGEETLIHHSVYAKKLRPLLPSEAFKPDSSKLVILFINMAILLLGWGIADCLDQWPIYLLWLYLPLALIMGNSIVTMGFFAHDFLHGSVNKKSRMTYHIISFLGFAMMFMPSTQWKYVHNIVHHSQTNYLEDPDRNYLYHQPNSWGKWIQNFFAPAIDKPSWLLIVGLPASWLFHQFCHISSSLLFNNKIVDYVPAAFTVSQKDRLKIALELFAVLCLHFSILFYLDFHALKIVLGYLLPLAIGHTVGMFYIYTNHLICRMTSVNDPLINSVSLRVPKIFDLLHFNFSYHTEHHIFPSLNSDYYPLVQELIEIHYPGRMNLLDAGEAWQLLMQTPRHYKDEVTLTDYLGKTSVNCPLDNSAVTPLP